MEFEKERYKRNGVESNEGSVYTMLEGVLPFLELGLDGRWGLPSFRSG